MSEGQGESQGHSQEWCLRSWTQNWNGVGRSRTCLEARSFTGQSDGKKVVESWSGHYIRSCTGSKQGRSSWTDSSWVCSSWTDSRRAHSSWSHIRPCSPHRSRSCPGSSWSRSRQAHSSTPAYSNRRAHSSWGHSPHSRSRSPHSWSRSPHSWSHSPRRSHSSPWFWLVRVGWVRGAGAGAGAEGGWQVWGLLGQGPLYPCRVRRDSDGCWATSLCAGPSSGSGVCCPLPLVALTSVLRFLNLASSSSCWRSVRFPRSPQQLVTCLCAGPMGPAGGSVVPRLPYIRSVGRSAD